MIKGKSKFDFEVFHGDWAAWLGISKQKYTKEEAVALWEQQLVLKFDEKDHIVEDAFVRYRFGRNEDNEPCSGWWLEWKDYGSKSVPAWSIRNRY